MSGLTYNIAPGNRQGTWQWEIRRPDGSPWAWGASAKPKAELERDLKKTCIRHSPRGHCPIGFNNVSGAKSMASARRGSLRSALNRK